MLAPMARGVRRPAGAARSAKVVLGTLVTTLLVAACGGVGQPATYDATGIDGLDVPTASPDPADFVEEVDNPWFPLRSGETRRYVVEADGEQVGTVRVDVLARTVVSGVEATAVRTRTSVAGEGPSTVTRYYAQDEAGNVWLLGEDADEAGWRAGQSGAEGGLAMPAEPRIGDGWVRALVPGRDDEVVRVTEPGASTAGGVWTSETGSDGTETRNVYARDVGLLESVVEDSGRATTLVSPPPP